MKQPLGAYIIQLYRIDALSVRVLAIATTYTIVLYLRRACYQGKVQMENKSYRRSKYFL